MTTSLTTKKVLKETTTLDQTCVVEEEVVHEVEGVAGAEVEALRLYVVILSPRGAASGEIPVIFYTRVSMDRLYKDDVLYIENFLRHKL